VNHGTRRTFSSPGLERNDRDTLLGKKRVPRTPESRNFEIEYELEFSSF
jgi:hypothetical protein